jgi:thioredoxin
MREKEKEMEHLTLQTFREKIFDFEAGQEWSFRGELPAVIDFYADWCGPCKMVAPVLEELSREYAGKVNIYKINTEQERELSAAFGIRSIPSILFIPKDDKPRMSAGAMSKQSFLELFREVLKVQ